MSKTVLIAEDENFLREMLQMEISEHGIDVVTAANGQETIEAIESAVPSLLLLDLLMPKVDGYAVLEHIRQKGYSFPVIVLSNLSDSAQQEACTKLGVKDFLIKSNIDEDELWKKVELYL